MSDQEEINRLDDVISMLVECNGQASVRAERAEDTIERLQKDLKEAMWVLKWIASTHPDDATRTGHRECILRSRLVLENLQGEGYVSVEGIPDTR